MVCAGSHGWHGNINVMTMYTSTSRNCSSWASQFLLYSLIGNSLYIEERGGEGRGGEEKGEERGLTGKGKGVEDRVCDSPLYVAMVPFQLSIVVSHPRMKCVNQVTCTGCQLANLSTNITDKWGRYHEAWRGSDWCRTCNSPLALGYLSCPEDMKGHMTTTWLIGIPGIHHGIWQCHCYSSWPWWEDAAEKKRCGPGWQIWSLVYTLHMKQFIRKTCTW